MRGNFVPNFPVKRILRFLQRIKVTLKDGAQEESYEEKDENCNFVQNLQI